MKKTAKIIPNDRLRQERKLRGWTQRRLASEIGTSEDRISRWEAGFPVRQHFQEKLCDLFGRNAEELGFLVSSSEVSQHVVAEGKRTPNFQASSSPSLFAQEGLLLDERTSDMKRGIPSETLLLPTDSPPLPIQAGGWSGMTIAQVMTEIDEWHGRAAFGSEFQVILTQRIRMTDQIQPTSTLFEENQARRAFLHALATLPLALLTSFQQGRRAEIEIEAWLVRCVGSLTACWYIINDADFLLVEELLSVSLPTLEAIAQQYSRYQQVAAHLATQGHLMQAILALHQLAFARREAYCLKAVHFSSATGDYRLQAAALMYLGYTYCYTHQPGQALSALQRALRCLGKGQSLLRSDIYMGLAYAHACCREEHAAREAILLAQRYFPSSPQHDASYLYASCSLPSLHIWEGRTFTALAEMYPDQGHQEHAWDVLSQMNEREASSERDRTKLLVVQAQAALAKGDLEACAASLDRGWRQQEQLAAREE